MGTIAQKFGNLINKIGNDVNSELRQQAGKIKNSIASNTPVVSGRLKNSYQVAENGDKVIIYTNVKYAPAIEYGKGKSKPAAMFRKTIDSFGLKVKKDVESAVKRNL